MNSQADRAVTFFDLGEDCIRVESSFLTGQEQVFVNDQLISKKRSWRYSSTHAFEINGQAIEVRISIGSILRGPVVIELWVNGEKKDSDEWDLKRIMQRARQPGWKALLMIFLWGMAGAVVGFTLVMLFKG